MNKKQRMKNRETARGILVPVCPNCGKKGRHYVPASFGDAGFYVCSELKGLAKGTE